MQNVRAVFFQLSSRGDVLFQSLEQLVGVMDESSRLLEASLVQARSAQVIQGDTMGSMAHLVETVHLLTQTTHAEIVSINQTASALKESLNHPGSEWLKAVLVSLLQHLPGLCFSLPLRHLDFPPRHRDVLARLDQFSLATSRFSSWLCCLAWHAFPRFATCGNSNSP
jgi:hypothetical protein